MAWVSGSVSPPNKGLQFFETDRNTTKKNRSGLESNLSDVLGEMVRHGADAWPSNDCRVRKKDAPWEEGTQWARRGGGVGASVREEGTGRIILYGT